MLNFKSVAFLLISFFTVIYYSNAQSSNNDFFLSDSYENQGVKINYSAIVKIWTLNNDSKLALQLSSFVIEEAYYNNKAYKKNDILGISFPINTSVELKVNLRLLYGVKLVDKLVKLYPNKKTYIDVNDSNYNLNDLKIKISNTLSVITIYQHETSINDIKKAIDNNISKNYSKNEANTPVVYNKKPLSTKQNKTTYNEDGAEYEYETDKVSTIKNPQDPNVEYDNNTSAKVNNSTNNNTSSEYEYEYEYEIENKTNNVSTIKAIRESNVEYEYDYEDSSTVKASSPNTKTNTSDEYEYEYESSNNKPKVGVKVISNNNQNIGTTPIVKNRLTQQKETSNNALKVKSKVVSSNPTTNTAPIAKNKQIQKQKINTNNNSISNNYKKEAPNNVPKAKLKVASSNPNNNTDPIAKNKQIQQQKVSPNTSKLVTSEAKTVKKDDESFEVIKTKKGYIRHSKDEQAVVDSDGKILIPYGKYEIIRFKAGFARVKIKDDVDIKNIQCSENNEEYNWSARIYENPWKETVIDKNKNFVDKVVKKVEIYIVDNVANKQNTELSPELLKLYKDPNPFIGTQETSAHNLWNREHANDPEVINKRKEIQRLKNIAKADAYSGAKKCRKQVSTQFEEVYNYYKNMGYEIILKE